MSWLNRNAKDNLLVDKNQKLRKFILYEQQERFDAVQKNLAEMFNALGLQDPKGELQLALVGTIISTWLKTLDCSKEEKQAVLSGVALTL